MNKYQKRKEEVLAWTKQSFSEKLFAGTSGNLSSYDPKDHTIVITPSSIAYETMTAADIMVIDLDGNILEGKHRPSSEWRMHAAIYRNMPDVKAIVHTHSPYATSFAVNHEKIPVILIEMVPALNGDIPVAKFALPGTDAVGTEALKVLTNRNACLMANHGVLAIGEDLSQAHVRAVYVEDAARIYHMAKLNGRVYTMSEKNIQAMRDRLKKKNNGGKKKR